MPESETLPQPALSSSIEPMLRALAPALRRLETGLRQWLRTPHRYPLKADTRAALDSFAADLLRQAEAVDAERPVLVVMLMGGTGVGKSTLLNALAREPIAIASFVRPTTRDPVVYHHASVVLDRVDPILRQYQLVAHSRPELEQVILVDTPDLDSNDISNREKVHRLMPLADVVLYVGSQEKYHDKIGWDVFLEQRQRRAFAFVLNKWDRCVQSGATGLRPDEDLLRDLRAEGFQEPLLFRTCAQAWANGTAYARPNVPEGEQFDQLVRWLEMGLTRLEIEAIKVRGVGRLLEQLEKTMTDASPPDVSTIAQRTRADWERVLAEEAQADVKVLLDTLEPYQREIEQHFALEGQRRFTGLMAGYLALFTKLKYIGTDLRFRIPFLPSRTQEVQPTNTWDLAAFSRACTSLAGQSHLDARRRALTNRLLVQADQEGFPLELLTERVEAAGKADWRQRHAAALVEILEAVEKEWAQPTGLRHGLQATLTFVANRAPPLVFLGACILLVWQYTMRDRTFQWGDLVLPAIAVLVVLVILHILIGMILPWQWPAMRSEFSRRLERRLQADLAGSYLAIPVEVADALDRERRQIGTLTGEIKELQTWLRSREQAATASVLYGK